MGVQENKQAVRDALDRFNAGDLAGYMALYDDSAVTYGFAPEPLDLAGLRQFYEMIMSAFPGGQSTPEDLIAEDDKVVVRYTFRGAHQGDLMGVPASGNDVTMMGTTVLRFVDGRAVERWQSADLFGLMQQIGAIPAPAAA
jgi:steroid delta-isomerase-like uncharacterized protein